MTLRIPLSPQQLRQRRKNFLFFGASAGVSLAILAYLFWPELKQTETEELPPKTEEIGTRSTGERAKKTDNQGNAAAENRQAAPNYAAAEAALSGDPLLSGKAQNEEQNAPPSEEELAKLPPWQAAFARLSREDRVAFAVAFSKAKSAYNSEQWVSCQALLNDCELIFNGSPNVWNLRACALLAAGESDEAEPHINRSLELNPDDHVALMCRAELLMLRRDYANSITLLEKLRHLNKHAEFPALHDTFTFQQLLCHLMLRQEMEARALVTHLTPLSDGPLYYYSQAAFHIYKGDSKAALEPLRSATAVYGNGGVTASYRKWLNKCGLTEKYSRNQQN